MKQRYRFRFYPTHEQAHGLACVFGSVRYVYNWALRLRTDAWHRGEKINYNQSSAALTVLKKKSDHDWLNEISSVPTQQSLRHLQVAYQNFFEKRAEYPTFKKKSGKQLAEYTSSAFKWDAGNRNLSLAKMGRLNVRWSRTFKSVPTTVTVEKDAAGRYFVSLCLEETIQPLPKTGESIGVDLGINRLATLSNGQRIHNPRHTNKCSRKLARAQKVLARRKQGSHRRNDQRLVVAKIQAKIADTRTDYLHKVTTDLVRRFDTIAIEDLNVRGMVKNHNLARAISDASFGAFGQMLTYKCNWYGKTLVKVDRFFPSSKRCSSCGHIVERLPLEIRVWVCPACSAAHDRDENAARNILAAGHADNQNAQGGRVRPAKAKASKGSVRRTVNRSKKAALHLSSESPSL